jgi:predicted dehydrogenase
MKAQKNTRYAVVGLGHFAQESVLPAFANAKRSTLAALVSDDPAKLSELQRRYEVPLAVDYDGYEAMLASDAVDAAYIVVPNEQHEDFVLRTARSRKHVLVEKPMAVTVSECERMKSACDEAGVLLMVGYRLHFERANLSAIEVVKSGQLGELRTFDSVFTMQLREGNTRERAPSRGGGPLYDIGTYCINAVRNLFHAEPIEVFAFAGKREGDERFEHTHEQVSATMQLPNGALASFVVGFGASSVSRYEVLGTKGRLSLDPAYSHKAALKWELEIEGQPKSKRTFGERDQIAPEITYFSRCIRKRERPEPGAEEGLLDVRVIEALEESIQTGHPVRLPAPPVADRRPDLGQEDFEPANEEPPIVHAESPRG